MNYGTDPGPERSTAQLWKRMRGIWVPETLRCIKRKVQRVSTLLPCMQERRDQEYICSDVCAGRIIAKMEEEQAGDRRGGGCRAVAFIYSEVSQPPNKPWHQMGCRHLTQNTCNNWGHHSKTVPINIFMCFLIYHLGLFYYFMWNDKILNTALYVSGLAWIF